MVGAVAGFPELKKYILCTPGSRLKNCPPRNRLIIDLPKCVTVFSPNLVFTITSYLESPDVLTAIVRSDGAVPCPFQIVPDDNDIVVPFSNPDIGMVAIIDTSISPVNVIVFA